ncbi:MAG: pyridoxamine 5'-phosphate oxidase [Sediminibacterium sp.]
MKTPIADIRSDYRMKSLLEADVAANPFEQFTRWFDEALNAEIEEVNAMTLATASLQGIPSARIVLLKGYDQNGFVFFTNYNSQKGKDIAENPYASLVFFWKELERQVRIDGRIEKIHASESDAYFQSRPASSRIGAWSSPQSTVITDRSIIENNYVHFEKEFGENYIPRPNHWGGYVVKPTAIEFWQGRSSRMHDRMHYKLNANHSWTLERLAP